MLTHFSSMSSSSDMPCLRPRHTPSPSTTRTIASKMLTGSLSKFMFQPHFVPILFKYKDLLPARFMPDNTCQAAQKQPLFPGTGVASLVCPVSDSFETKGLSQKLLSAARPLLLLGRLDQTIEPCFLTEVQYKQ